MIDPHEYAERCAKGRSHETQKQRIASTEKLISAVQSDTLRWAADKVARMERDCNLEMADLVFRAKADAIERGTYHRSEK
jgi:hypothetical protein